MNQSDLRFAGSGSVIVADGAVLNVAGLEGFASGWFTEGLLTWASGKSLGKAIRVLGHSSNNLRLIEPPILPVETGDTFRVVAGCDKCFSTCKAKFGNGANFRGFPHLPGNDAAFAYVNGVNEYDGSALVP